VSAIITDSVFEAAKQLTAGEIVAIPTETVYGLAANALNPAAVVKVFEAKNRPFFDPLIVHTYSIDKIYDYAISVPEKLLLLMKHFSPGPITILVDKKVVIPDIVTSGLERLGIRIPNHELTLSLLRELDFPLCAPSANPFGFVSPTSAQHVADQLGDEINMILDGGQCAVGLESTIVGEEHGKIIVYRLGGLSIEEIEAVVGKVKVKINNSSNPEAPGMLTVHYAPKVPLVIGDIGKLYELHKGKRIALLSFQNNFSFWDFSIKRILSPDGNLQEAASNLFAALRAFSSENADIIIAEHFPERGLGRAINDRLRRAAVKS
jgi:L-threonylcarbamoyladenylate synthase